MELIKIDMNTKRNLVKMWASIHAKIADRNEFLDARLKPVLEDVLTNIAILTADPNANMAGKLKPEHETWARRKYLPTPDSLAAIRGDGVTAPSPETIVTVSHVSFYVKVLACYLS